MKRILCCALILMQIFSVAHAESEGSRWGNFWGNVGETATGAWNSATEYAGNMWNSAGEHLSGAWSATVNFVGDKSDEFRVWTNITGNEALTKLKEAFDGQTAEMQIEPDKANDLWLRSMEYAEVNGIAKVTQAKLTLAALIIIQAEPVEGDITDMVLAMLTESGITDQVSAENLLAELTGALTEEVRVPDPDAQRYYLGETVKTGKDNGFAGAESITSKDPHFGWSLGRFFVCGYTAVYEDENGDPIFIKTLGDRIELWFELEQDIDCLNGSDALMIAEDTNGFDEAFGIVKTNFGRGAMITQHTNYQNAKGEPQLYTDYLSGIVASGANTTVQLFEEGDYRIALNYEIKDQSGMLIDGYSNYRIEFSFSVRNGNCMVYPFDVATGAELTNTAVTENGFYLDLARSRYLDINIKREVLAEGALGLTEDVRFNRPAKDGDQYTDEGIYTITVSNRYTGQQTTKQIYVGTNRILMAHIVTGLSVEEIREQIAKGAQIAEDGTIIGMVNE